MQGSDPDADPAQHRPGWTFLSNHAHVLVCLDGDGDATMREVAGRVGITTRAVQGIVADLATQGYLHVERRGRRNHYVLDRRRPLRHPLEQHRTVGDLLDAVAADGQRSPQPGVEPDPDPDGGGGARPPVRDGRATVQERSDHGSCGGPAVPVS